MPPLIAPRIPSGTLELLPREQRQFQRMLDVIRKGFERFGFGPIETPVFEMKDVLLTKSGGETEKQVYFVQSTGALQQGHAPELALRFDLTVPLARYVAMHERDLAFPFRRYQIQRVYRGERPQLGREREFTQCDIDVIGKDALDPLHDAEIPAIIVGIFTDLSLPPFTIHFSNRKVLRGFLEAHGAVGPEAQEPILRAIDKLDKTGMEGLRESLAALGRTELAEPLGRLVTLEGTSDEVTRALQSLALNQPLYTEGVQEVAAMGIALKALGVPEGRVRLDLRIARGLDYYTGTVYETFLDNHPGFGSICSGGRYEDLAGYYTRSRLPGVGISIGATRLFEQLRSIGALPPDSVTEGTHVLIAQVEPALRPACLALGAELRRAGLNVETHLEGTKLDKQLRRADKLGIPFVVILGSAEATRGVVAVKDLAQKTQADIPATDLAAYLRAKVGFLCPAP